MVYTLPYLTYLPTLPCRSFVHLFQLVSSVVRSVRRSQLPTFPQRSHARSHLLHAFTFTFPHIYTFLPLPTPVAVPTLVAPVPFATFTPVLYPVLRFVGRTFTTFYHLFPTYLFLPTYSSPTFAPHAPFTRHTRALHTFSFAALPRPRARTPHFYARTFPTCTFTPPHPVRSHTFHTHPHPRLHTCPPSQFPSFVPHPSSQVAPFTCRSSALPTFPALYAPPRLAPCLPQHPAPGSPCLPQFGPYLTQFPHLPVPAPVLPTAQFPDLPAACACRRRSTYLPRLPDGCRSLRAHFCYFTHFAHAHFAARLPHTLRATRAAFTFARCFCLCLYVLPRARAHFSRYTPPHTLLYSTRTHALCAHTLLRAPFAFSTGSGSFRVHRSTAFTFCPTHAHTLPAFAFAPRVPLRLLYPHVPSVLFVRYLPLPIYAFLPFVRRCRSSPFCRRLAAVP